MAMRWCVRSRPISRPHVEDALLAEVVRSAQVVEFKTNDTLIEQGAEDDPVYLLRKGSVAVSRRIGGRDIVLAYLPAGNYVGEMAMLTKSKRSATVKAAVATEAIKIDSAAFRVLLDQVPALRREVEERLELRMMDQRRMELGAPQGGVIEFLIRQGLGEATDVLLIDEALCVRCDNCEKACAETHHGVSRLDREAGATFDMLHVPTSCRHCEDPHCMKDCPPDAIHRAPNGEVFIDDSCIGCGNCERNCPYGVIQMAAVPAAKPGLLSWLLLGRGQRAGRGQDRPTESPGAPAASTRSSATCARASTAVPPASGPALRAPRSASTRRNSSPSSGGRGNARAFVRCARGTRPTGAQGRSPHAVLALSKRLLPQDRRRGGGRIDLSLLRAVAAHRAAMAEPGSAISSARSARS